MLHTIRFSRTRLPTPFRSFALAIKSVCGAVWDGLAAGTMSRSRRWLIAAEWLAPLRDTLYELIENRHDFGRIVFAVWIAFARFDSL